jgi:hypothetical protein
MGGGSPSLEGLYAPLWSQAASPLEVEGMAPGKVYNSSACTIIPASADADADIAGIGVSKPTGFKI